MSIKMTQGITVIITMICVALLFWFLNKTRTGKSMRAYSDNENLALLSGINPDRVVMITWILVGILVTIAGTLYGLDKSYKPFTYLQLLLPIFAAAIVGGLGSPLGAIAGGFVIALSEVLVTFAYKRFFGYLIDGFKPDGLMQLLSTDYKFAVSFTVLVIVLLVRPTGIFKANTMIFKNRDVVLFGAMGLLFLAVGVFQSWNLSLAILNLGLISAIMALGVNIQWGYAGLLNVGVMGFAALGGLAAILVSAPPVQEAWVAGGGGVIFTLLVVVATIIAIIFAYNRTTGARRRWLITAIGVIGFFCARYFYGPATQAIEQVNPATSGYLVGQVCQLSSHGLWAVFLPQVPHGSWVRWRLVCALIILPLQHLVSLRSLLRY